MATPHPLPYHYRPKTLDRLRRALDGHARVVLSAPRGYGKTSLINTELAPCLRNLGWQVHVVQIHSPPLPDLLDDLRQVVSKGDPQILAALCDHGGIPAHMQAAQALSWLCESSYQPQLLVLEDAHHLTDPGNDRLLAAMHAALHARPHRLRVLFTVSNRLAMEELFARPWAPFKNDAYSVSLESMSEDFLQARRQQMEERGFELDAQELSDCLLQQSFNLALFERTLQSLLDGSTTTLAQAVRQTHRTRLPAL